ncbi:1-acyl-sn-glycerol-3-phosphate acyltransferase [Brachybacterium sp. JHP9]|uniref:1-acyl-sn-glycerol-3-phosphate acyltransferase n=1 Tax=Brachybacterium equifaecis TaxID=2910770 RepID=A0ABT0R0R3_9MICO|nr:lysophospholipid acyltransferase family protein [Brachybacterium equifaecis]MCL6423471.1 1-acyl-sn-glycerol-3-phosphate acyltransferase [Brachybacterium equifaecis]
MAPHDETPLVYRVGKSILIALMRLPYRPQVRGQEHIPATGPVILASSHLAGADTIFLPTALERTVHFLGKSDLFAGRSLRGRIVAAFMRSVGVMPVDRTGGGASSAALEAGLEVLRRGHVLGIYPEGTRSPDGRLYRGKTGVARLALASGAPIVPVAMTGTFEAQRGRRFLPRRHPRITTAVGAPIDVAQLVEDREAALHDQAAVRRITDTVMARIQALSGQEYAPQYAASAKAAIARGESPLPSAPAPGDDAGAR